MNSQISNHISTPSQTQTQTKPSTFNKAYFSSKNELLSWASKLLDACHPGSVRLNKVNWKANCETDYISNFKIFQQGLVANDIYKPIDINRLTKGKQYDLNELLQWIYGYYLSIKDNIKEVYNAKKKRGGKNFVFNNKKNEIKKKYRNKINRNISRDKDNLTQISTTSCNQSSNNSISNGKDGKKYFFNVSNLRQNLRNNNYNCDNNEDVRYRNKSKQETKNNKYFDLKEKLLNNNNNNAYCQNTQNKMSNNINTINNNIYTTINRRYPSNQAIIDSDKNSISNNFNTQSRRNFKNIFEKTPSEYQLNFNKSINDQDNINYEMDELENQNVLDITDFFGLNEEEIKTLIKEEKKDGCRIQDLKNIIRKLRINILSMEKELTNIKKTISEEYKLKNFYLNKLKDIEYLYFNPVIKNSNENKNTILRQLLCSNQDSTIYLDESNYAFLRNINHKESMINNKSTLLSKKKSNKIIENMNKDDIIMKDRIDNNMSNRRLEINVENIINQNNNINNHEKSNKLNYSSKKNYNANYIDNLFDSFNDNSKLDNTNYNENKNPNLINNNRSNTFYTNNNTKITNENSNLNYQRDNGKIEEVYNGKKYFAYSEKKKDSSNDEDKNRMNNKTEFKGKGNNLYSEISSLLLNDSLHIPNI